MAHTVFISYAQSDKDVASKVCSTLESRGIQCWIAPRDVPIVQRFSEAIVEAIKDAKAMVLVLSSSVNDSPHVISEVNIAASRSIPIVTLRVEDFRLTEALEFYIATFQWLDATTRPLEECLEQLGGNIERILLPLPTTPKITPTEPKPTEPEPAGVKTTGKGGGKMKLLSNVKAFLKEFDWKFTEVPGETTLRTGFKGKSGSWSCIARTHEDKDIFLFYSILSYSVPEDKRTAAAEYLTRANYGLRLGNFEMDFNDGEVRYKTSVDVEGGTLAVDMVKNMVLANVLTVDRYLAGLNEVIFGKAVPAEAVKEAEEKTKK